MGGMCLIAFAWRQHPRYRLALAANRDEAHARPSAAAAIDPGAPTVYGGRDLVQDGSWLQVCSRGRLAAVTNVRNGPALDAAPRSRGWLVRDFVRGDVGATEYAGTLAGSARHYGPFNLLAWDGRDLAFASNSPATHAHGAPGVHAMSNGAFDAAWPKSALATRALEAWLATVPERVDPLACPDLLEPLFEALADTTPARDESLPDTGVGLALERRLSPPFISDEVYGTRCSTIVLATDAGFLFAERRFGPCAARLGDSVAWIPLGA